MADYTTEIDSRLIPTGRLMPVQGTPFDFNTARPIGRYINAADPQLENGSGYDHYFVLSQVKSGWPVVRVLAPETGIQLEAFTTEPGLQFYTANSLQSRAGKTGISYGPRSGFCLEPQFWPDAPNQQAFPTAFLKKGDRYHQSTGYRFSLAGYSGRRI